MRVYSFKTWLCLEDIAKSYGFKTVSDFIREAIRFYIVNNKGNEEIIEEAKLVYEIEEIYKQYMRIRRMLSTEREIRTITYMLEREGVDLRIREAIKKLLEKKSKLEKRLVEKIVKEVLEDVEEEEGIGSE